MNRETLVARFQRELVANPKKAALMGLMALVALYFWAPLVMGWLGTSQPSGVAKPSDPNASLIPMQFLPQSAPTTATPTERPRIPWQQLAEWIEKDARTRPMLPQPGQRDPFRCVEEPRPPKKQDVAAEVAQKHVIPQKLPLALSGTIVSEGRGLAVINGKTYRLGDEVRLGGENQRFIFRLVRVDPQQVTLATDGGSVDLKMQVARPPIEIERIGQRD